MVIPHFRGEGIQFLSSQDTKLLRTRAGAQTLVRATLRPIPEPPGSPPQSQGSDCTVASPARLGKKTVLAESPKLTSRSFWLWGLKRFSARGDTVPWGHR